MDNITCVSHPQWECKDCVGGDRNPGGKCILFTPLQDSALIW